MLKLHVLLGANFANEKSCLVQAVVTDLVLNFAVSTADHRRVSGALVGCSALGTWEV